MTPATRQAHRRAQFAAAVIAAGWLSDSEYITAVINALVKVPAPTKDALQRRELTHQSITDTGDDTMAIDVTVTLKAMQQPMTVRINGYDTLTPRAAIAARNVAGSGPAAVSDGKTTYYIDNKNHARKYHQ